MVTPNVYSGFESSTVRTHVQLVPASMVCILYYQIEAEFEPTSPQAWAARILTPDPIQVVVRN